MRAEDSDLKFTRCVLAEIGIPSGAIPGRAEKEGGGMYAQGDVALINSAMHFLNLPLGR